MDSRAYVKIEFSIYGSDYKMDSSFNWSVGSGTIHEIDRNIEDFFVDNYLDARAKWEEEIDKANAQRREAEEEARERAEYERLKAKFG